MTYSCTLASSIPRHVSRSSIAVSSASMLLDSPSVGDPSSVAALPAVKYCKLVQ